MICTLSANRTIKQHDNKPCVSGNQATLRRGRRRSHSVTERGGGKGGGNPCTEHSHLPGVDSHSSKPWGMRLLKYRTLSTGNASRRASVAAGGSYDAVLRRAPSRAQATSQSAVTATSPNLRKARLWGFITTIASQGLASTFTSYLEVVHTKIEAVRRGWPLWWDTHGMQCTAA